MGAWEGASCIWMRVHLGGMVGIVGRVYLSEFLGKEAVAGRRSGELEFLGLGCYLGNPCE